MQTDMPRPVPPVRPLPEVLEALRERGLRRGVNPGPMTPGALPTGHPTLDAALRTGGWPRGAAVLLDAPPGSGATSLALGTIAAVQAGSGLAAWIDAAASFDPAGAAGRGVQLEWLLVARPRDPAEGLELAGWLARSRLLDLLVIDLGEGGGVSARAFDHLAQLLARAGGLALLLANGSAAREVAARSAGVRLSLSRTAWLSVGRDLVGQRVSAEVTRHRWALSGGRAELDLWFAEGRRIDPLLPSLAKPQPVLPATVQPGESGEPSALRVVS